MTTKKPELNIAAFGHLLAAVGYRATPHSSHEDNAIDDYCRCWGDDVMYQLRYSDDSHADELLEQLAGDWTGGGVR